MAALHCLDPAAERAQRQGPGALATPARLTRSRPFRGSDHLSAAPEAQTSLASALSPSDLDAPAPGALLTRRVLATCHPPRLRCLHRGPPRDPRTLTPALPVSSLLDPAPRSPLPGRFAHLTLSAWVLATAVCSWEGTRGCLRPLPGAPDRHPRPFPSPAGAACGRGFTKQPLWERAARVPEAGEQGRDPGEAPALCRLCTPMRQMTTIWKMSRSGRKAQPLSLSSPSSLARLRLGDEGR